MRKLKLQMQMSADGFVAGNKNELDWMTWEWDDDLKKHVQLLTDPVDCIILGRKLADGFIDAWEFRANDSEMSDNYSKKMNKTPKIVFSKTLNKVTRKNTSLAKGDLVSEITQLKSKPGKDIIVYGGVEFVSNLIKAGLIDEFHLFINPIFLGDGKKLYEGIKMKQDLKLIGSKGFKCGIVSLHYIKKSDNKEWNETDDD